MFNIKLLNEIKNKKLFPIMRINALQGGVMIKSGRYEIIELEEVTKEVYFYKCLDHKIDKVVTIGEFFPQGLFGSDLDLLLFRDFEDNFIQIENPSFIRNKNFDILISSFIEEAYSLEKLFRDSSLFKIREIFKEHNTVYIVINYREWPSLDTFFKMKFKFTEDEINWITKELLKVIIKFHNSDIVYKNLSPKKIYIKNNGIEINDIDTFNLLNSSNFFKKEIKNEKYLAPEVISGDEMIGSWTDCYSIGKILFELLHLKSSFDDKVMLEKYDKVIKKSTLFHIDDRVNNSEEFYKILFGDLSKKDNFSVLKFLKKFKSKFD